MRSYIFSVKIHALFRNLLDVRQHIMAKMFVVFTAATLSIVAILTGIWYGISTNAIYQTTVDGLAGALFTANTQVDSAVEDIMRLHGSLIYGSDNISRILHDELIPPAYSWFEEYKSLLELLKTMVTHLSRTLAGTGFFKPGGESCVAGSIMVQGSPFHSDWYSQVKEAEGSDILLLEPRTYSACSSQMPYSVLIVRTVLSQGEAQAVLVSNIKDSVIRDAFSAGSWGSGFVLVLDSRGRRIFDSAPGRYEDVKPSVHSVLEDRKRISYTGSYLLVTDTSPVTDWTAAAAVPISYIHGSMKGIRLQFLTVLLISLLVVATVSIILSRSITYGLQTLNRNMKLVSNGELTGLKALSSCDEVGELSRVFLSMVEQIQQLLKDIEQRENQKRIMEIRFLRAQISPHFLYNALNTISYLAVLQNAENIRSITASLIDLLHAAVISDDTLVTVDDEIRYALSYLAIQQYRYAQNIAIEQQIEEEARRCQVPRMVLQPIVENAVIHGLSAMDRDGHIRIRAWQDGKRLVFSVTDNGIGMSDQQIQQVMALERNASRMRFSGIGLRNVDERIKLQFGKEYGITIYSQPDLFTTVEIHMPVIKGEDTDVQSSAG